VAVEAAVVCVEGGVGGGIKMITSKCHFAG